MRAEWTAREVRRAVSGALLSATTHPARMAGCGCREGCEEIGRETRAETLVIRVQFSPQAFW